MWSISHDFTFDYGGAERVTEAIAQDVLPDARVYCVGGHPQVLTRMGLAKRSRFLLPAWLVRERGYRQLAPAYAPLLLVRRPLEGNLISSSYAMSHYLRCTGRHVIYCHSPLRQAWSGLSDYLMATPSELRMALLGAARLFRRLDRIAVGRADKVIATSSVVRARIARYWNVDSEVIPPPVDISAFAAGESVAREDFFLWVGRIVEPYKRLSLLLAAFRDLPERLLVVGSGRDAARLAAMASDNVSFIGQRGTDELSRLYGQAKAVLFPSTDDFGMVPIEAMACGTPVIAYRAGGALDTVVEGQTGVFFDKLTPEDVRRAVRRAAAADWDRRRITEHAARFGKDRFALRLKESLGLS